jgi:hypothetical protein
MSISSSAVLVELNIGVWTANKIDRSATQKVADDSNASSDAGMFRKNLMAGTTKRKAIADYAAICRTWHNTNTMPWADRGPRLLPTARLLAYKTKMNEMQARFNTLVDEFERDYPALVQMAPHYLGALFDPSDYPSADEVRSKFSFRLVMSPVPESGDFRLDTGMEDIEELRRQYDVAFEDRVKDAMRDPWNRLHETLVKMAEKLGSEGDGRWSSKFVTGAQDLCSLLSDLNVTKDPQLEQARQQLERALAGMYVEDLKENAMLREDMKGKLDKILQSFEW